MNFQVSTTAVIVELVIFLKLTMAFLEDDDFDIGFLDFGFPSHDIRHCRLHPYACSLLCGSANPECDLTGQCNCYHPPSSDCGCTVPTFFESGKCSKYLCRRKDFIAHLCSVNDEKFCVCAPAPKQDLMINNKNNNDSTIFAAAATHKVKIDNSNSTLLTKGENT